MMIRFFSIVAPRSSAGGVGLAFLAALEELGIATRALPIGPAVTTGRWRELGHLFTVPMQIPFVNIVCAPCDMPMGVRAPVATLGGTTDLVKHEAGARDVMVFPDAMKRAIRETVGDKLAVSDVVYEPTSVFAGLWTAGVPNIAIVTDVLGDTPSFQPTASELVALAKYDFVIACSPEDAIVLAAELPSEKRRERAHMLQVVHVEPRADALGPYLDSVLEAICVSATSVPMTGSAALAARPATTWLRSTRPASPSTSPSSVIEGARPRSLATRSSTGWRASSIRSILWAVLGAPRRIWSWFMRRRGS